MQAVYDQVLKVARTDATVLVTGETGTGKELVAETLHELSERSEGPFVPLNCGAISPNLIESELFGHEKGSFTGATERRFGCFERADGGTLFLDEITEMSADLQVKLLRALESNTVQRVGGNEPIPVDVRVIAATNRDPHPAVADGSLREDLLYRLLVFPIHMPPLRNRDDDLDLLADYFLAQHNRRAGTHKELTRAARERLRHHPWPGNVRELRNVIERAFIMAETDVDAECISLAGAVTATRGRRREPRDPGGDVQRRGGADPHARHARPLRREEAHRRSARDQPQDPVQPAQGLQGRLTRRDPRRAFGARRDALAFPPYEIPRFVGREEQAPKALRRIPPSGYDAAAIEGEAPSTIWSSSSTDASNARGISSTAGTVSGQPIAPMPSRPS